jgi:4-amino-4-deoxy-L-arabinose transferase-like glycosyltransferase
MKPSSRQLALLIFVWAIFAAILILRAGRYPAAMTGDEIWFAESAWNFLNHGTPARAIHQDGVGSAIADCLPPIIMLLQAAAFSVLGVTQAAIGAPSVIMVASIVLLVFALARQEGAGTLWAGLASIAVLGSQVILRASLYSRYEGLVAAFFLAYAALTLRATGDGHAKRWHLLRGAALCLAGLSYYPTAPFVALAALPFEAWCWRRSSAKLSATGIALIGFVVPALPFLAYIARYPDPFLGQVIGNGGNSYLTFELPRRLFSGELWQGNRDVAPDFVLLVGYWLGGFLFHRRLGPAERLIHNASLLIALPALIFPFQARLLALPMALALAGIAVRAQWSASNLKRLARAGLAVWAGLGGLGFALILITAIVQWQSRDYDAVTSRLDWLMSAPGQAGIDQRAWLAMRSHQPTRPIEQVFPATAAPQALIFRSTDQLDPNGGKRFRYLVLSSADAKGAIDVSPALKFAFAAGEFVEIGRVEPDFTPLPWARNAPYDLVVYERRVEPSKVRSEP